MGRACVGRGAALALGLAAGLAGLAAAAPAAAQGGVAAWGAGGSLETTPYAAWTAGAAGGWSYGSATVLDLELLGRGPSGPVRASAGASL